MTSTASIGHGDYWVCLNLSLFHCFTVSLFHCFALSLFHCLKLSGMDTLESQMAHRGFSSKDVTTVKNDYGWTDTPVLYVHVYNVHVYTACV